MKSLAGIEYETKPLTLSQRAECNDLLAIGKTFSFCVLNMRHGLARLGGAEIDRSNFDELVNKLSMDEIAEIGMEIFKANNFSDKKKS